ncbi:MAG: glycosyltransferase family 9 protein [Kiritimatiellae bacterium]|nr:glycosyltransferase family 9 protein [Kiritimatiellia bacterium]
MARATGVLTNVSSTGHPRLLVLRGGALGDLIVTLPVLSALRNRWPGAYIELVSYPYLAEIATVTGLADRVASLHAARIARFFALRPDLPDDLRAYMRSFDIVFNFFHDPEETVHINLETAGAPHVISASPLVKELHAVDHFLKPLESLAIYEAGAAPALVLPRGEHEAGVARLAPYRDGANPLWVIQPGSGSPKKNWPLGRFTELARRMKREHRLAPIFLLGEADDAAREGLTRNAPDFPRLENLTVREVAQVLAAADGYIGNDSGISHLAAAVGARTFALFGPSNPALWSPRGPRATVLQAPEGVLDNLAVETVLTAIAGA